MIGLFCKRDLSKRRYSAKETYILIWVSGKCDLYFDIGSSHHPLCLPVSIIFFISSLLHHIPSSLSYHIPSSWVWYTYHTTFFDRSLIGLFCKRDLSKRRYSAKETCKIPSSWVWYTYHTTFFHHECDIMSDDGMNHSWYLEFVSHSHEWSIHHSWEWLIIPHSFITNLSYHNLSSLSYHMLSSWVRYHTGWLRSVGSIKL